MSSTTTADVARPHARERSQISLTAVVGLALLAFPTLRLALVASLVALPVALLAFIGATVLVRRAHGARAIVVVISGVVAGLAVVASAVVLLGLTPTSYVNEVGPAMVDEVHK